jgi:hypothetical protein
MLQAPQLLALERVVDGIALGEIAVDMQLPERANEVTCRVDAQLPDPPCLPRTVASTEFCQGDIRFAQQQRGAGGRAAEPGELGLEDSDADAGAGKDRRDRSARQAAADDDHVDIELSAQRWMGLASGRLLPIQPQRPA